MTEPLFYSSNVTAAKADDVIVLDSATSSHAIRSQRLQNQSPILISDGQGILAEGLIETADPQHTTVRIKNITLQNAPLMKINLVQALAKGDRDLLAAEMATEVGVDSVTPWQAQRSIVRIRPERAVKALAKWDAKLQSAAQQARRARIPHLNELVSGTQIASLHDPANGHYVLVLHEDGHSDFNQAVATLKNVETVHLVVGPEGGVAPEELEAVTTQGGSAIKIGTNIMRTSTAGPIAIALLNQMFNRW